MGDPQETTETDLAWLAGFIDGEGNVGIYRNGKTNPNVQLLPRIQVANTSAAAIHRMVSIYDSLGISVRVHLRHSENPKWADAWYTQVNRLAALARLLPLIIPYLVVKRPQAELMLRFVKSRVEHGINRGGNGHIAPLSEQEQEIVKALQELNSKRRPLTDYTRDTLQGDDIVGPPVKIGG